MTDTELKGRLGAMDAILLGLMFDHFQQRPDPSQRVQQFREQTDLAWEARIESSEDPEEIEVAVAARNYMGRFFDRLADEMEKNRDST